MDDQRYLELRNQLPRLLPPGSQMNVPEKYVEKLYRDVYEEAKMRWKKRHQHPELLEGAEC